MLLSKSSFIVGDYEGIGGSKQDIKQIKHDIKKQQNKLLKAHKKVIHDAIPQSIKYVFSHKIVKIIADYSIPTPSDVRFCISDDESTAETLRDTGDVAKASIYF